MKTKKVITPYFENGTFAGARVCVGGEDFIIAPKDYWDGKELPWQEAMDALKADNLATWNYRQICLTMAYRKEIERYSRIMAEMALIIGIGLVRRFRTSTRSITMATMAHWTFTIRMILVVCVQSGTLKIRVNRYDNRRKSKTCCVAKL